MTKCPILSLAIAMSCMLLSSCLTTKGVGKGTSSASSSSTESEGSLSGSSSAPAPGTVAGVYRDDPSGGNTEAASNADKAAIVAFMQTLQDTDLVVSDYPAAATRGNGFAKPFVVRARRTDGSAEAGLPIMVTYPISRDNDTIHFATAQITTDADGLASFMPDAPQFAFDSTVTFTPMPPAADAALQASCHDAMKSAPFLVRTDAAANGGVIYVWDYGENGKPLVNSAYLLKELIAVHGVRRVGNAPFSSAAQLSKSDGELYQAMKPYNQTGFMIYGTVHYAEPVSTQADGRVLCSLVANLKCMDLVTGKVLYITEQRAQVLEANKTLAIDSCRKVLAKIAARAVMYGM